MPKFIKGEENKNTTFKIPERMKKRNFFSIENKFTPLLNFPSKEMFSSIILRMVIQFLFKMDKKTNETRYFIF